MNATRYNLKQVEEGAWEPGLFVAWPEAQEAWLRGVSTRDWSAFERIVRDFQRMTRLLPDGMVGPLTVEMIHAWLPLGVRDGGMVLDGTRIEIGRPVVRRLGLRTGTRAHKPYMAIMHVDCTFDADSTWRVLSRRGLSTHFCVDGDEVGTIHQWADPVSMVTYHAGRANTFSVGIDVNTPLKLKYADRDAARRGRRRPVERCRVFGKMRENLGYFPEQVESLRTLSYILSTLVGIPERWPRQKDGTPLTEELDTWRDWSGWLGHHHVQRRHYCPGSAGVAVVDKVFG